MGRKKLDPNRTELIPEDEFEDALSAVLRARPEKVNENLSQIQAENKARREQSRKNA